MNQTSGEIPAGLAPATNASAARWILDGLVSREYTVRGLVPEVFEDYCRVFHPALAYDLTPEHEAINLRWVTWREISAANGMTFHPEAQFEAITGLDRAKDQSALDPGQPPLWLTAPEEGSLDDHLLVHLGTTLAEHTSTPEHCYFAHWGGYGGMTIDERHAPTFGYPWPNTGRDHLLFTGPVGSCRIPLHPDNPYSVNLWWPEDRAWFVVTDIDLDSTYIGGSNACIEAIVDHHEIEALRTQPTHLAHRYGDKINPPLHKPD